MGKMSESSKPKYKKKKKKKILFLKYGLINRRLYHIFFIRLVDLKFNKKYSKMATVGSVN